LNVDPKIVYFDIESAPSLGYTWGKYEQNVLSFKKEWYMLSFATKWQGKKTTTYALPDYPGYDKNRECDKHLVAALWRVFDEADILIAHNGRRFDVKKSNARFAYHGMKPPSPYKIIDTLDMARRSFAFTSNKLDDLAQHLGVGKKLPHTGMHLWFGCMHGDPKSWGTMRRYNARDCDIGWAVYEKLRAFDTSHPKLTHYTRAGGCPTCQSQRIQARGFNVTRTGKRQRFQCRDCGAWSAEETLIKVA
jgi:DNA polymerase elongation subunit (family B)